MRRIIFTILIFLLCLNTSISYAQTESSDQIAIYTPEFEYLENATNSFELMYSFDPEKFNFMETSKKTTLWNTPECEPRKIVKFVAKGYLVKTYKFFAQEEVYAVQYRNSWGFMKKADLITPKNYIQPIEKTDLDSPPRLLNSLSAIYPAHAKRAGITGKVILKVHISNTGAVSQILIEKSIPQLDTAALKAVKKLRFKPAKKYGIPVDSWVRFPVTFCLNNK